MPEKWVVNASPLISLARLNQTSLLFELCDEMVIPSGVAGEINQGMDDDPAKLWFHKSGMDRVKDVGGNFIPRMKINLNTANVHLPKFQLLFDDFSHSIFP